MEASPQVDWEDKNVHAGDIVFVEGVVLPLGRVKITVKVIPSNVASNVYHENADITGKFSVAVEIPDAPSSLDAQALVTVSGFGYKDTNSHAFHYLG